MTRNFRCRICNEMIKETDSVAITKIDSIAHITCNPTDLGEGIEKEGVFRVLMEKPHHPSDFKEEDIILMPDED